MPRVETRRVEALMETFNHLPQLHDLISMTPKQRSAKRRRVREIHEINHA
jgi:hypothetical protein